mmetsp:Transcript_11087/g.18609  ORF Transcript_11087/g.18609 Transcript_11087/m.18609 type:complete len:256 (-) Transcript_11087:268-1035(-)
MKKPRASSSPLLTRKGYTLLKKLLKFSMLLLVLFVLSMLGYFYTVNSIEPKRNVSEALINSHIGGMMMSTIEVEGSTATPVIAIPGMNPRLFHEWTPTIINIADTGRHSSVLMNFNSNPHIKPGKLKPEEFSKIVNEDVMKTHFHAEKVIIMGKSWGGGQAIQYALNNPNNVEKLVLVAPASSSDPLALSKSLGLGTLGFPVFLAWAEDDPIMPAERARKWKASLGDKLTTYTAKEGGHVILDEFVKPIANFVNS